MSVLFWELFLITFPLSVATTEIDPCVSHKELRDSHRSRFRKISGLDVAHCDEDLTTGWYRFKGKAGLQMPDTCVNSGSCGTHAPGWFTGSHPTVPGNVSSGKVCFNWIGSCCRWSTPTRVKRCNEFYVYLLPKTALCDLQYCGDGAADPDCAADNNDIAVNGSVPGFLSSPNFPSQFPNSLQCIWRITAPAGMKVRLVLKNVTLGSNDYIVFRDGLKENSTQIAKYANFSASELLLYSTDQFMLVNFVLNDSKAMSGFRLEYQSVTSKDEDKTTTTSSPSKVTTTKPADYAMDVTCDKDEINAVLHIRSAFNYDPKSVCLNDASCKPAFQNDTHIFVKSTLEDCGTTSFVSKDGRMIVYRNAIYADVKSKHAIGLYATRDHQAVFEFQCQYKRRTVISTVSFDPSKLYIITDIESFGNFTFEMNMFKSGQFREYYTEYPVGPIDVGAQIFLQVSVKSNDSGLVVLVEECKATPSADYDDQAHYIFIENGCSKDKTLQYNYTLSAVQRFSLSAFSFRFEKSSQIYLHCQVKACRRSEPTSRCAEGCPFGKRKKRGSLDEVDQLLAIGPIIVSVETRQAMKKTAHQTPEDGTIAFAVLAGVLGFIVMVLVAALVLICKTRRTPNSNGAATILVREDEPDYG